MHAIPPPAGQQLVKSPDAQNALIAQLGMPAPSPSGAGHGGAVDVGQIPSAEMARAAEPRRGRWFQNVLGWLGQPAPAVAAETRRDDRSEVAQLLAGLSPDGSGPSAGSWDEETHARRIASALELYERPQLSLVEQYAIHAFIVSTADTVAQVKSIERLIALRTVPRSALLRMIGELPSPATARALAEQLKGVGG